MKTENLQALEKCINLFEKFAVSALGAGFFKNLNDPILVQLTISGAKKALENESGSIGSTDSGKGNPAVRNGVGDNQPKKERKKRSAAAGSGSGSESGSGSGSPEVIDANQQPLPFDNG